MTESPWRTISTSQQELRESNFKELDSRVKQRRTPAPPQSTTRLCSIENRMQTIAWRAPGKNPRRIQNHSSQSTSKTMKRTTIRGHLRIRPRGWPWKKMEVPQRVAGKPAEKLRHRRQRGTKPSGRRALGVLSILQALTIFVFSQS